ncbi:VWA domain-containing protein [Brevibacterium sp. 50QC2O2]|uniref:VWA domain-containing protein n=1 Tax=Brevibacterium TaxID=1696 RepID=UPI00211B8B30|nr:VWA domain-containing protein [Brevibacterium sp. 91QC2O2]MCQ9386180.1 VWA domain-containing protein [Brevibacterium sp. 68QC2CO]MCQ9388559.1 VWA domain-containing protein [Brevibacterium sp. 50QC2O2]
MPELARVLTDFAAALRAQGLAADPTRVGLLLRAVALVDPLDVAQVRAASRTIMCSQREHPAVHDRVFDRYFGLAGRRLPRSTPDEVRVPTAQEGAGGQDGEEGAGPIVPQARAARTELLRHVDLGASELAGEALALMERLELRSPRRRSHRVRPAPRGTPDERRTLRLLARGRELDRLPTARPRVRRRPVIVVADVSASMDEWLPALLRFMQRAVVEIDARAFALGTRLTHLSPRLTGPGGVAAAQRAIPDLASGTRLGDGLHELVDSRWREAVRGSVFVLISDGWERGDCAGLEAAAGRIGRLARHFVWINPRAGRTGFAPEIRGMRIAQRYSDALIPATTVADWQRACTHIAMEREMR